MANDESGGQNHVLKPVVKLLKSRKHKISAAIELCKVSLSKTKKFEDDKQILSAGDFEYLPEKMPFTPKKGGSNLDWGSILSDDGLPTNNMPCKEKNKQKATQAVVEKQSIPASTEKKELKKESKKKKVVPTNEQPEPYYEATEKPKNKMPENKSKVHQKGEKIDRPLEASMPKDVIPKKTYFQLRKSASPPDEVPPPYPELPTNDIPLADACKSMCGLKVTSRPIVQPFEKRKKLNDQGHPVGPRAPSPPRLQTSKRDLLKMNEPQRKQAETKTPISVTDNIKLKPGMYNVHNNRRRSTTPPITVHKYTPSRTYQKEHLIKEGELTSNQADSQNTEGKSRVTHNQGAAEQQSSNQNNTGLRNANAADKNQELTSKTTDALQVKVEHNLKKPVRELQDNELQQKAMSPQQAMHTKNEINPGSKVPDPAQVQVHKPSIVESKARLSGIDKKLGKRGAKRKQQKQETEDGKPKEIEFEYREEPRLYIKPPKVPLSKELTEKIKIVENDIVPANVPKNYRLIQVPLKPGEVQETYLMKLRAKMQKEAEEKALANSKSKAGQQQKERSKSSTSVRGCRLTTQEPPKTELSDEAIAKKKEELKAEALREASLVASKALQEVKRIFQNAENKFIPIAKEAISVDKILKEGVINLIDTMSEEAIAHSSDQNIANDRKGSELVPNLKKTDTFSSMNSRHTSEKHSEKGMTNTNLKKPPIATSTWDKKQNINNNVEPADIYTIQKSENADHQVPTSIWGEISLEDVKVSETAKHHPKFSDNQQTENLQVEALKQGIYKSSNKNDLNTTGKIPANNNTQERIPSEQETEQKLGPEQKAEGKGQQGESNVQNNPNYLARRYGTDLVRNPGPVISSAPSSVASSLGPPTRPPSRGPPSQTPPMRGPPTSGQGSDDGSGKDPPETKLLLPSNAANQKVQATIKVEFQIVQDENNITSIQANPKIDNSDSLSTAGAKIQSPGPANAYVNLESKEISSRKNKIEMINNKDQKNIENHPTKAIPAQRINSASQNQNEKFITPNVKETVKATQQNVSQKQGNESMKANTQDHLNSIADVNVYYYDAESMEADEKREESVRLATGGKGHDNFKVADEGRVALASMLTEEKKKADAIKLADAKLKEEAIKLAEKLKTEAVKLAAETLKVEAIKLAEERRKIEEIKLAEENRKAAAAKLAEEKHRTEELKRAEEKKKAEALKLAEEEKKAEALKLAEEKKKAEDMKLAEEKKKAEALKLAEEKKKAEALKLAEEKKKAEALKLAEEKKKAEDLKLAEEKKKAEALKLAEEKKKAEALKLAEEKKKAEALKLAEEKKKAEDLKLAEEKKKAEALKLAEEKKKAEDLKLAEEKKKAEALKLAEEKKKAEALKLAEEKKKAEALKLAEEKKKAEVLKLAEEKRKADEASKLAEEKKKAEALRVAEERKKAEVLKLAEERKKAEALKLAEEKKKAEALRVAEEKKTAEALRVALERKRVEENRRAEEKRLAEEKRKAQLIKVAEERRKAEELRLATEKKRAEAIKLAAEKKKAELRLAEEKKRVEAVRLAEEKRKLDEIKAAEEKKRIEAIKLAEEKWKAEAFKLAEEKRKVEALRASEERWKSEALKLAEEKKRADAIKLAQEKRRAEEIRFEQEKLKVESLRLSEQKWKTEAIKLAAEKQMAIASKIAEERRRAEAERLAKEEAKVKTLKQAEDKQKAEAFRKAEEARLAEAFRQNEERRKVEEFNRAQQRKIDEAVKLAAEKRVAEAFKLAEEKRKAAELEQAEQRKKADALRLAAEKRKAEEIRISEEKRKAEAIRQARAEEIRMADEKKKNEAMKLAEEKRKAEEIRLAVEKKTAEAMKVAEERKRAEALRLAEEKRRSEEIRLAEGGRKAEMLKITEQKRKEEEVKLAEEKKKAEAIKLAEEKWKAEVVKQAEEKRLAEEIKVAEEKKRTIAEKLAEVRQKAEARKIVEERKRMEAIKLAEAKKKEEIIKFNEGKTRIESVVEKPRAQKFDHIKEDEREVITKLSKEMKDRVVQVTSTSKIGGKVDAAKLATESNNVAQHLDKHELQQPTEQSHKSANKADYTEKSVGKESSESERKRRTEALKLTEVKRNAEAIKQAEQRSKAEALKAAAEAKLNEEKRKREELKAADLKKKQDYLSLIEKKRKTQAAKLAEVITKNEAVRSANEKYSGTKTSPASTIRPAYEGVKKSQEQLSNITMKTNSASVKTITPNIAGERALPNKTSQTNVDRPPTFRSTAEPLKDDWTKNLPSSANARPFEKGIGTFYDWTTPSSLARKAALHMDVPIHQQSQRRLDGMKRDINKRSANKMYQMSGTPCQTNLPKPATPCPICPDAPGSGAAAPPANAPPSASAPPPPGDLPPRPSSSVQQNAEQVRTGPPPLTGISKYFNSQTISGRANVAKATFAMMGLYALNRMMKKPSKESKPHAK